MGKSSSGGFTTLEQHRTRLKEAVDKGTFAVSKHTIPVVVENGGLVKVDLQSKEFPDFTPAVNKGAILLDTIDPDWYMHIDVSALNLDDENMCVLGQSWNHYKVIESAVAEDLQYAGNTNFTRYLKALFGKNKNEGELRAQDAASHGFAFSPEVYSWMNIEGDRRVKEEGAKITDPNRPNGKSHISWVVDAELWEHLTKTWLVLIEARQNARKKADEENIRLLTNQLTAAGVTNPPADEIARKMVGRGIYTVAEALTSLASDDDAAKQDQPKTDDQKFIDLVARGEIQAPCRCGYLQRDEPLRCGENSRMYRQYQRRQAQTTTISTGF